MKQLIAAYFILIPLFAFTQSNSITGNVYDEKGVPLVYGTVALLNPADSTLSSYSITNDKGYFDCKIPKPGSFLMQVSYLGYQTYTKEMKLPRESGNEMGVIVLKPIPVSLGEVNVVGEHVPIIVKKDTIEFNASAFKTKPDAVAEDLLKKLPGVEVDRAGNIKAMGEDVRKVMVDGKEFFSNDPKVATKNLPADAIKKVQVYDKKSDETEFTGVFDGSHNKVINMVLQDDRKNGLFGELLAGGATDKHYQLNGKVFRFDPNKQYAAIGMVNNINQFGFSFQDYLSYRGGIQNFIAENGGSSRMRLNTDDDIPVDFGQPVTGLVKSSAAGLNFSRQKDNFNRFNLSYLSDGVDKDLDQNIYTRNYTSQGSFEQQEDLNRQSNNNKHWFNLYWKNRIDSVRNMVINGSVMLSRGAISEEGITGTYLNSQMMNKLNSLNDTEARRLYSNLNGSYIRKLNGNKTMWKLAGNVSWSNEGSDLNWNNQYEFYNPTRITTDKRFQDDENTVFNGFVETNFVQQIGTRTYIEPGIRYYFRDENLNRSVGIPGIPKIAIDSLSPDFNSNYSIYQPRVLLRYNGQKARLTLTTNFEIGKTTNSLVNKNPVEKKYFSFLPGFTYENEYQSGRRVSLSYESSVNKPTASQLLPVVNKANPLVVYQGNPELKPEQSHELMLHWLLFDQFSFTTINSDLYTSYTKDRINWSRQIAGDLSQTITPVNVSDDYSIRGRFEFSTPIRKIGMTFHAGINESWNRGISFINSIENINKNFSHSLTLSLDNRNKNKWDINIGGKIALTDAKFSLQESMNNRYFNLSYFTELRYNASERWNFEATADVTNYNSQSFNQSVNIPLIGAKINYFTKNKRWGVTLSGFDLLNKNTGIQRLSELNYLREIQSNVIGRYLMLSLKYKLNKFSGNSGINVQMNRR